MKMKFRVYGIYDGERHHRHACSFEPSRDFYFDRDGGVWLHEACADETGTHDYVEVTITATTEAVCIREILSQNDDGLYENCRTGEIVEVRTGRIIDYNLLNDLLRNETRGR